MGDIQIHRQCIFAAAMALLIPRKPVKRIGETKMTILTWDLFPYPKAWNGIPNLNTSTPLELFLLSSNPRSIILPGWGVKSSLDPCFHSYTHCRPAYAKMRSLVPRPVPAKNCRTYVLGWYDGTQNSPVPAAMNDLLPITTTAEVKHLM